MEIWVLFFACCVLVVVVVVVVLLVVVVGVADGRGGCGRFYVFFLVEYIILL